MKPTLPVTRQVTLQLSRVSADRTMYEASLRLTVKRYIQIKVNFTKLLGNSERVFDISVQGTTPVIRIYLIEVILCI